MTTTLRTLNVTLCDEYRTAHMQATGVALVTDCLRIDWCDDPGEHYLCVRNMQGLNDQDVANIVTALAAQGSPEATRIVTLAEGFVSFHTPHLPSTVRLYRDG